MCHGELVEPPKPTYKNERRYNRYSIRLSIEQLEALAKAGRVAGKVCDTRWTLNSEGMLQVRKFLVQFKEELALSGSAEPEEQPSGPTMEL